MSVYPIGLAVHASGASVMLEGVAVGSWGRESSIAVRAAALYCVAFDSETAAVDARRPSAGSGLPVYSTSDEDNSPVAADNGFVEPSIPV